MMTSHINTVRYRDWECNISAWHAGVGLVRVHADDLQQHQVVMAAIAIAANESCIVFTTSYGIKNSWHLHAVHQAVQLYCMLQFDAFGNAYFKMLRNSQDT